MIEQAPQEAVPGSAPVVVAPVEEAVLELAAEEVAVSRRTVQGQTVRIATTTRLREQQVAEELARETVEVERVAVGRIVDATPATRDEGDVTIIPVMEEVLVVERRLVLKEEIRIRRIRTTEVHRETVQLRQQSATITRIEPSEVTAEAIPHATRPTNNREKS